MRSTLKRLPSTLRRR
uniref:Uncharacterized protein n=1 Tax=Arundo donax TaxID=35708 RepID=A0A0A8Y4S7_ARUDO